MADIEDAEKVICAQKAPYPVQVEAGKTYYYCTCGRSKNQVNVHSHLSAVIGPELAMQNWVAADFK